jgi:hypothetical protein
MRTGPGRPTPTWLPAPPRGRVEPVDPPQADTRRASPATDSTKLIDRMTGRRPRRGRGWSDFAHSAWLWSVTVTSAAPLATGSDMNLQREFGPRAHA